MKNEKRERFVLTNVIATELDILKRHVHVLKILQENEPAGIIKLSELTKHPQHVIRYSLRILEKEDLIKPSRHGAETTDAVSTTVTLLKTKLKDINETIDELMESLEKTS